MARAAGVLLAIVTALPSRGADGEIKFKPPVHYTVTSADYGRAVDLDQDGKIDIVGSDWNIGVFVLWGKGDGTFQPPVYYPVTDKVYEITVADVNKDGKPDLVTGAREQTRIAVLLGTGPRQFGPATFYESGLAPYGVSVGDLNEDGWLDIVSSDAGSNTLSIFLNKGNGTFNARTTLPCAGEPNQTVIADFDLDGHLDIAASAYNTGVYVFRGNGTGAFGAVQFYSTGGARVFGILGDDFNNDGWLDLAVANYASGTSSILLNEKNGQFAVQGQNNSGSFSHLLRAADLDLDGRQDLIVPNSWDPTFTVLRNNGYGNLAPSVTFQTGGNISRAVAVADFNGDRKPDVAVSDVFGNAVHVFINDSDLGPVNIMSVTVTPFAVPGGADATATVKLSRPAPQGGVVLGMGAPDNPSVTFEPDSSVIIPEGSDSAVFTVRTQPLAEDRIVQIQASSPTDGLASCPMLVTTHSVTGLTITPNSVFGGQGSTGTVTLSSQAPVGGLDLALSSSSAAATSPATVTVPAGATSATFPISTTPVASNVTAIIKAEAGSRFRTASLYIYAPVPKGITYNPAQVRGGMPSTATLTITGKAPAGGLVVNLEAVNPAVTKPDVASVTVPAGQTSATFGVTTYPVASLTVGVIKATASGKSIQIGIRVYPAVPRTIKFSANPIHGGKAVTATLTLTSPAPAGGLVVALGSQNTALATVPASVTVGEGETTATFTVQTYGVNTPQMAVITASANGYTIYFGLRLYPAVPKHIQYSPNPVKGGNDVTATLFLHGSAPSGGLTVALTSQQPDIATGPASVFVPEGQSSAQFTVKTKPVTEQNLAVFKAIANGVSIYIGLRVWP